MVTSVTVNKTHGNPACCSACVVHMRKTNKQKEGAGALFKVNTRSGSGFGQTVKYLTLLQLRRMMDGWLDGRKDKSNGASGPSHLATYCSPHKINAVPIAAVHEVNSRQISIL
ncbi:unnamed protein product [Prunus armeniaca]